MRRCDWRSAALAVAAFIAGLDAPATAAEFKRDGQMLRLAGPIEPGDAAKFRSFVEREYKAFGDSEDALGSSWAVSLDSPGGSLADGIDIGRVLHKNRLTTLIERGHSCYSACAIAFLGGVFQYVTGVGPKREIDVGAQLGFHGYRADESQVVILNEAFDQARALNGLVLEYGAEMTAIDLGFLSELMNVPATGMRLINTSSALKKLHIELREPHPKRPANAGYNVCVQAVTKLLPSIDGFGIDDRLERKPSLLTNEAHLLRQLLSDHYEKDDNRSKGLRAISGKITARESIELVTGQNIYLDSIAYPVERYQTGRGSGFYYDQCYVFFDADGKGAQAAMVSVSAAAIYSRHGALDFYPPDAPLWK